MLSRNPSWPKLIASATVVCFGVVCANGASAQTAGNVQQQPAQQAVAAAPVDLAQVIAANKATPAKLSEAIAQLVAANPDLAQGVIDAAVADPTLMEPLAEGLAKAQEALKIVNPEAAKKLATVVASASSAFQAFYAVALQPGEGNGNGNGGGQVADAGGDGAGGGGAGGGGGGGGAPYSPGGSGGSGGFGGGPVSPN
jgi:hypothetical protein